MMKTRLTLLLAVVATTALSALAGSLPPDAQAKVDEQIKVVATWAADPVIVDAVRTHNAALPSEQAALDQAKWHALTLLDPIIRGFVKSPAGQFLKSKKTEIYTEAFVSDAAGLKVGFLAKPTNWSHQHKAKHDFPMTGKTWQGPVEVDESAGRQQLQISVPVLDGGQPIGSLVVGLSLTALVP